MIYLRKALPRTIGPIWNLSAIFFNKHYFYCFFNTRFFVTQFILSKITVLVKHLKTSVICRTTAIETPSTLNQVKWTYYVCSIWAVCTLRCIIEIIKYILFLSLSAPAFVFLKYFSSKWGGNLLNRYSSCFKIILQNDIPYWVNVTKFWLSEEDIPQWIFLTDEYIYPINIIK